MPEEDRVAYVRDQKFEALYEKEKGKNEKLREYHGQEMIVSIYQGNILTKCQCA